MRQQTSDKRLEFDKYKLELEAQIEREKMANDLRIAELKAQGTLESTVASVMGKQSIASKEMQFKATESPDKKGI